MYLHVRMSAYTLIPKISLEFNIMLILLDLCVENICSRDILIGLVAEGSLDHFQSMILFKCGYYNNICFNFG